MANKEFIINSVNIPTLFCYGSLDNFLDPDDMRELTTYYNNKTVKEHDGGHFIPGTKEMRQLYLDYITKFKK